MALAKLGFISLFLIALPMAVEIGFHVAKGIPLWSAARCGWIPALGQAYLVSWLVLLALFSRRRGWETAVLAVLALAAPLGVFMLYGLLHQFLAVSHRVSAHAGCRALRLERRVGDRRGAALRADEAHRPRTAPCGAGEFPAAASGGTVSFAVRARRRWGRQSALFWQGIEGRRLSSEKTHFLARFLCPRPLNTPCPAYRLVGFILPVGGATAISTASAG